MLKSQHDLRLLSTSYWQARVLHVANALGLFSFLEKPRTLEELAHLLGVSLRGVEVLLPACASFGLVKKKRNRFKNTSLASRYLVPGSPEYQGDMIRMYSEDYGNWENLEEIVRIGKNTHQKPHFEPGSPDWDQFMDAMYNTGVVTAKLLVKAIPFKNQPSHLLDVGGGPGAYSIAFCKRYPKLQAVIFDLPQVESKALFYVKKAGLEKRIVFCFGDYTKDAFPDGKDLILFSNILHANSLEDFVQLLKKAWKALLPKGMVLVNDFFLNKEKTGPLFPSLFGIHMLVSTSQGRTYSVQEIRDALRKAKFSGVKILGIKGTPYQTVIAIKAG
jgi:ubiquinone/menaquinone biosynthesis C-methylase UbiE